MAKLKQAKLKVVIQDYEDRHRRIIVGSRIVFDDNQDEFTCWTMQDVLAALGITCDWQEVSGNGGVE